MTQVELALFRVNQSPRVAPGGAPAGRNAASSTSDFLTYLKLGRSLLKLAPVLKHNICEHWVLNVLLPASCYYVFSKLMYSIYFCMDLVLSSWIINKPLRVAFEVPFLRPFGIYIFLGTNKKVLFLTIGLVF